MSATAFSLFVNSMVVVFVVVVSSDCTFESSLVEHATSRIVNSSPLITDKYLIANFLIVNYDTKMGSNGG